MICLAQQSKQLLISEIKIVMKHISAAIQKFFHSLFDGLPASISFVNGFHGCSAGGDSQTLFIYFFGPTIHHYILYDFLPAVFPVAEIFAFLVQLFGIGPGRVEQIFVFLPVLCELSGRLQNLQHVLIMLGQ